MATCIHSSRSCLPPFYTIPVFPLLNRKIFHLLVSLSTVVLSIIGMAMVLSIIQYILKLQVSLSVYNLTTGMDRPHQNTHSIKKLAN